VFFKSLSLLALSTNLAIASPAVTSWDAASEFTDAGNPNFSGGVWSYGEEMTLNCALCFSPLLDLETSNSANLLGWGNASTGSYPLIMHNVNQTSFVAMGGGGPVTLAPHGMFLHPGASCEYAVARFTAPANGTYKISGQFFGLDDNGSKTTTDVHVSVNGVSIYDSNVNLNIATKHYASFTPRNNIALLANGTVDFQVGCGGDGYNYDSTGLNAVIEAKLSRKK
jgi:hypothetical protein